MNGRLVRALVLIAAILALLPATARPWSAVLVSALSPWVAISSLLATRTLQATAFIGLAVAAGAMVRRRWFCRWMCPTGLCADGASRLGRRLMGRASRLPTRKRGRLRYGTFGQWIALATLGGACLGYPVLLWLDPLALLSGTFGACGAASSPAAWVAASGLPVLLLLSVFLPGVWCGRLCPLGALQDVLSQLAGSLRPRRLPAMGPAAPGRWRLARRVVLGAAVGAVWAAAARAVRRGAPRPLRPPGAGDDTTFAGLCVRCGNCVRACPSRIIEPDLGDHGLAGLLTPTLCFRYDYCREDCTRCMDVCPSGALARRSLADKPRERIGLPRVDMDVCLLGEDRECAVCRNCCPYEAIALVFSEKDYTLTPVVDPRKCPGCGACEAACPTRPVRAIVVEPATT